MEYFSELASQLGISLWLLVVILLWSLAWKLLAFWKSARRKHVVWFIVFAIVNTIGILEILYIYVFSDMMKKHVTAPAPKKTARKRKRK